MKIKTLGDALVLTSAIKLEVIEQLQKFANDTLALMDPKNPKNEIFRFTKGDEEDFRDFGITFVSQDAEGYAQISLMMPAGMNAEEKLAEIKNELGNTLTKIKDLETQILNQGTDVLSKIQDIVNNIEIG